MLKNLLSVHGVKESVFGVILVRIFSGFSRIRTEYGEIRSPNLFSRNAGKSRKNADQNNSEYGLFLRSGCICHSNQLLWKFHDIV